MAKLTKQVKEFMWTKVRTRILETIAPMNEQARAEEARIAEAIESATKSANELFQSMLKAALPELWAELEQKCATDHWTCLPRISTEYTYKLSSPMRDKVSAKKKEMENQAEEKFNELLMEVELGGVKKDEVLSMIANMEFGD